MKRLATYAAFVGTLALLGPIVRGLVSVALVVYVIGHAFLGWP